MYSNAGVWLRRRRAQRATDMEYPLQHRETGEHGHSVDGRGEELEIAEPGALREEEPGREDHDPHGARRQADLAFDPECLGAGPRVAHHQREQDGQDDRGDRGLVALAREEDGYGREDDPLLDAVQGRVEV